MSKQGSKGGLDTEFLSHLQWLAAWCEETPTVTRCPQYQEKEQIVFTKKGEWWLIIDSVQVIGEFGLPSDL